MRTAGKFIVAQFQKLFLLPDYFRALAKEWVNILFGETLVGIVFLLWWALANPPNPRLIVVFVAAMFVAGYYAWRADYVRLIPKFTATEFTRYDARTVDTHYSAYFQVVPRCVSDANVEECVGLLTRVEGHRTITDTWEVVHDQSLFLQWSFGDHRPITLYAGAEKKLNIFYVHRIERRIHLCVPQEPINFIEIFDPVSSITTDAFKFVIIIKGKDSADVKLAMILKRTGDAMNPQVSVEPIAEE